MPIESLKRRAPITGPGLPKRPQLKGFVLPRLTTRPRVLSSSSRECQNGSRADAWGAMAAEKSVDRSRRASLVPDSSQLDCGAVDQGGAAEQGRHRLNVERAVSVQAYRGNAIRPSLPSASPPEGENAGAPQAFIAHLMRDSVLPLWGRCRRQRGSDGVAPDSPKAERVGWRCPRFTGAERVGWRCPRFTEGREGRMALPDSPREGGMALPSLSLNGYRGRWVLPPPSRHLVPASGSRNHRPGGGGG